MPKREEERRREYDWTRKTPDIAGKIKPLPDSAWKWPIIWIMLVVASLITWGLMGFFVAVTQQPFMGRGLGLAVGMLFLAYPLSMIVMECALAGWRWLSWVPYAGWHGSWYQYDNQHLRFAEVGDELWFVDRDIAVVLGLRHTSALFQLMPTGERMLLEDSYYHVISPRGVEWLMMKVPDPKAKKMLVWFQREVYPPHARKIERERERLRPPPVYQPPDVIGVPPALAPRPKQGDEPAAR